MLNKAEVLALCRGEHGDPFAVLGLHADAKKRLWLRSIQPGASAVHVIDADSGEVLVELAERKIAGLGDHSGFFEASILGRNKLFNHGTMERDLAELRTDLVFNLCDEGWNNDPFKELHVPALLEIIGLNYTGAAPSALAACYDKGLVRAVAQGLDVPVPLESYVRPGDQGATLPSVFPALLKPNQGDSSQGITKDSVVHDQKALLDYLDRLRTDFPKRGVLVQEFLTGAEYSVGLVGNPDQGLRALPILEVDFSRLDDKLPKILGYESKWEPESPYWTQIRYREATLNDQAQQRMIDHSTRLFERLGCRDYARFDFRADAKGEIKLLEVNPNPGWCWDGKLNIMAGFQGMRYSELLSQILQAAVERTGVVAKPAVQPVAGANGQTLAAE